MDDILMILGLLLVGFVIYRGINNKPIIPGLGGDKKKKKSSSKGNASAVHTQEIRGNFRDLIGLHAIHGNMIELKSENQLRRFTGAIKVRPINYLLRSYDEQVQTDNAFEDMLARLSLGPGREVPMVIHVQSRPIELVDQLKQYHDNFPNLSEVAQRYAQSMFYPFMEQWQNSVDEYAYSRYIFFTLEYTPRMLDGLGEKTIIAKALNEFTRLANTAISSYGRMGGLAQTCGIPDLLEAMYFATHKSNASIEDFRRIMQKEGLLSYIVEPDFERSDRPAFYFDETEQDDFNKEEEGDNEISKKAHEVQQEEAKSRA